MSGAYKDIFSGKWKQIEGKLTQQWAKLTNDDLKMVEGKYDELVGKLQERYGLQRDEAEKNLNKFLDENDF